MTQEEAQAIQLAWQSRGGTLPIPESEVPPLLAEVRERVGKIEAEALQRGHAALAEGRRFPRKHQRLALLLLLVTTGLAALWLAVSSRF